MQAIVETIIAFIEQHQAWIPLIMVVFAAAETTAFLSIIIPSTPILVAVGALAATGAIPFWSLWAGATAGALLGSFFSYWLGWRYGANILAMRPLKDYPEMVEKTRTAFAKYGPVTVLIGHFMTIFRPVVFLMSGMSGMPLLKFAFWNTIGATAWAYIVPKAGHLGGDVFGWIWTQFH